MRNVEARLEAEDLGLTLPNPDRSRNLKGAILPRKRVRSESNFTVLEGINLSLAQGDRLGLIGPNGAGKSTLLRVLGGIYSQTAGSLRVNGAVGAVIDVGAGLDPESTGLESIRVYWALRGFGVPTRDALTAIGDFSGLGEWLSRPTRTYSAGMKARLLLAMATSVSPDILLLDEGIGTADLEFNGRANERLASAIAGAGILVMATHSTALLREYCTTAAWMHMGRIRRHGPLEVVLAEYVLEYA